MPRPKRDDMPRSYLSPLEEDLLILLNGRKLYAVEIERILRDVCGRKQRIGSLYPTLRDMEKRGLLAAEWGDELPEERGGPRRRYYTITDDGKEVLKLSAERRQELINLILVEQSV